MFKNILFMNHWLECIDRWHGVSLGQDIQFCSNEVQWVPNSPAPGGYIFI